jgi:hypothetical protein
MIVSELQYFPPIIFFTTSYKKTYLYLDIYEVYRKMSFRNRCIIAGAEGPISLSVPLQDGRNQRLPVNEVLISNSENWQSRHFKSILSAYNRSPFFEYYREELAELYKMPFSKLADWNLNCLGWVIKKLDWPVQIRLTEKAIPHGAEGIDDRRDLILPKNYAQWKPIKYRQVFEEKTGFHHNPSILDILFNLGPRARDIIIDAGKD